MSKFRLKTNKQTPPGVGAGVSTGAARRQQAEVATAKLVCTLPHKLLRNPINQLRGMYVVLQVVLQVAKMVVEVKTPLQMAY